MHLIVGIRETLGEEEERRRRRGVVNNSGLYDKQINDYIRVKVGNLVFEVLLCNKTNDDLWVTDREMSMSYLQTSYSLTYLLV